MMPAPTVNIADSLPRLADSSRVWIYQAESKLTEKEIALITQACKKFVPAWQAHGTNLKADYRVLFDRFICLFVDESGQNATGCSIDSSAHFIQQLEKSLGQGLMQRTRVIYLDSERQLREVEMNEMKGVVKPDTLVFNNLVATLGEMKSKWILEAKESWHGRMLE